MRASARDAFLRAAAGYADTERQLASTGDRRLRGETALALAGVEYHNLQDWAQAAQWARTAAELLGDEDPYRRARAQALEAAAWIELAPSAAISTGPGAPGSGHLGRARQQFAGAHGVSPAARGDLRRGAADGERHHDVPV